MDRRYLALALAAMTVMSLASCTSTKPTSHPSVPESSASGIASTLPSCVQGAALPPTESAVPSDAVRKQPATAPAVSPSSGIVGTQVSVSGNGLKPSSAIDVVGLYAEHDCEIAGVLATQALGSGMTDANGSYKVSLRWPVEFSPYYGTEAIPRTKLLAGRYYVLVFVCNSSPCSEPDTLPAGPFTLLAHLPPIPPNTPSCTATQLRVAYDDQISEATEQNTLTFVVRNVSGTECTLKGYPGITLIDASGKVLPFMYRQGGDQMLTNRKPELVGLPPGGPAYFAINKNSCVTGESDGAARTRVLLPGISTAFALGAGYAHYGYCGSGDPGHVINISPIEPTSLAWTSLGAGF